MSVEKKQIVQKALDILNRDGLDGVTLRHLATELQIKAASIYWHIPSKSELLDEMANAILEKHFSTYDFQNDQQEWAEWLNTLAHELRTALLAYQDGARVVAGSHPDINQVLMKLWDLTIRVLHNAGCSYGMAATIMVTVINFTFGSVIEEQSSAPSKAGSKQQRAQRPFLSQALTLALEDWQDENDDTRFDTGVRIIINGVQNELNTLRSNS